MGKTKSTLQTNPKKNSGFTSSSIFYQVIVLILTFVLGLLGTKLWEWGGILFNNSFTSTKSLDFRQGYNYLVNIEGVWDMFAIGGAIVFIIILCIIIVITYIARKNEDKKEQERARKQESLPQEIAQSIKTVLGVKTTLVDDIVEAYKRLKAQDEQECKNRKDTKT